jgi:hypothetical protein
VLADIDLDDLENEGPSECFGWLGVAGAGLNDLGHEGQCEKTFECSDSAVEADAVEYEAQVEVTQ